MYTVNGEMGEVVAGVGLGVTDVCVCLSVVIHLQCSAV